MSKPSIAEIFGVIRDFPNTGYDTVVAREQSCRPAG
jgi:hypothetical protein